MSSAPNDTFDSKLPAAPQPSPPGLGQRPGSNANPLTANVGEAPREPPPPHRPPPPQPSARPERRAASYLDGVSFVMDVPVEIRVEIGRRRTRIAELLQLSPGSILELDTPAGDPLNIYVNKRLIARGEAVMVGDRYGVRIIELLADDDAGKGGAR